MGIEDRAHPVPIGIGTFQKTHYGGFLVYDFHDSTSGGNLFDASYVARFHLGMVTVYPQIGVERRSAKYVHHLYGVTAAESATANFGAYSPASSVSPNAGMTFQYPLSVRMNLTYQVRKKWLDASIADSPLVNAKSQNTSFWALTRSFD